MIWMTDGWFPSNRFQDEFDDFEEERRLLYVADDARQEGAALRVSGDRRLSRSGDGRHAHALALPRTDSRTSITCRKSAKISKRLIV